MRLKYSVYELTNLNFISLNLMQEYVHCISIFIIQIFKKNQYININKINNLIGRFI